MPPKYSRWLSLGGASSPGPLIATFRATRASASRGISSEFGAASGEWTLAPDGAEAGFGADADRPRLSAPDMRPAGWGGIEAVGGDGFSSTILPWFGEVHNQQGVGGAIVAITAERRVSLRTHSNQHPREIRVAGAATPIAIGDTIELRAYIRA